MAESAKTIDISILGRSYKIACEDGERDALMQAVAYLDSKMGEIKKGGKVSGTDRIGGQLAPVRAGSLPPPSGLVCRGEEGASFDLQKAQQSVGADDGL